MASRNDELHGGMSSAATEKQSALIFFALIFILTIPFWVISAVTQIQILPALPLSALAVVCPTLAASILLYRQKGLKGVGALLKRSFDFKRVKSAIWYVPTILLMPLIMILSYGVLHLKGVPVPPPQFSLITLIALFAAFIIGAIFEELGWTGYITEPLQKRFGALGAALIIGIIWAIWHVIPLLSVQRSISFIAWWALGTVAYRVIIVWLYNNTGQSVFIAALFHAMANLTWQLFPINGSYYDPAVTAPMAAVAAIIAIIVWRPQTLARSHYHRSDQVRAAR